MMECYFIFRGFGVQVRLCGVSRGFPEGVHGSMVFLWVHGVFPPGHNALDGVVFGWVHFCPVVFVCVGGAGAPVVDLS